MQEPIRMPALSDTMQTGRLHRWLKQPGEQISKGEVIAEIESDKAVMELEAFRDGYLAGPLAPPESDIPVGQVIGYLTDSPVEKADAAAPADALPATPEPAVEASAAPSPPDTSPSSPAPAPPAAPDEPPDDKASAASMASGAAGQSPPVSPYARSLAKELGISLQQLRPGADGIVHASQVIAAVLAGPSPKLEAGPPFRIRLLTPMHRAVAQNMNATLSTPVFRVSAKLDLGPLKAEAGRDGGSLSLLLARACALSVREHPGFNAAFTPQGLAIRDRVDVGIAVDVPGGLVTPVLRDAAGRPLDELAEDWRILKEKTKRGRLQPQDYEGATFYLSNLGMFPVVTRFEAIVPLGAAAILAVGAADADGQTDATLSCDHRVVFGADAARFLTTLVSMLADPQALHAD